ncbi:zinc ribbon domain-containing protein [uncultured Eubacterium sp.]|uniref:zinc ribbon domain-containing protein n=1 Tax=uncultured Eubacterium sp. TaxID=165185 RepID=UPI0032642420
MYCKHCGTQLADWQKTCHICGTPVDSDAKKTFLDDIDFSETEELSDAINADEGKTKIFNVEDDDISKTQDLSGMADTKIFEENKAMEFEDIEPQEVDDFNFNTTDFQFDDEAENAQKERAGVIEDLFYGETDDDGIEEDELEILRESNKNKKMSIIALALAVAAILIVVLVIILANNLTGGNKDAKETENTTQETTTQEYTTEEYTTKATVVTTYKKETTTEEKTTEKKTKKAKETTTAAPTTVAPTTEAATVAPTTVAPTQAATVAPTQAAAQDNDNNAADSNDGAE